MSDTQGAAATPARPNPGAKWFILIVVVLVGLFVFVMPFRRTRKAGGFEPGHPLEGAAITDLIQKDLFDQARDAGIVRETHATETTYTLWDLVTGSAGTTRVLETPKQGRTGPRFQIVERQNQAAAEKVFLVDNDAGHVYVLYHDPAKNVPWWGRMVRGTVADKEKPQGK